MSKQIDFLRNADMEYIQGLHNPKIAEALVIHVQKHLKEIPLREMDSSNLKKYPKSVGCKICGMTIWQIYASKLREKEERHSSH